MTFGTTIRTETKKVRSRYGRARGRRRRRGLVLFVLLAVFVAALPFVARTPEAGREALQRATHPLEYEGTIQAASAEYGVEPALVAAVIRTESRFAHDGESSRGAYGLMQILPETAAFIQERSGIPGDYREPATNIRMGTWYLAYLYGRYEGDERLVLAAYNSGEGRVDRWLSEGRDVAGGEIPFAETRNYVGDVLASREVYRDLYGPGLTRQPA
jgi:soluble lytic murein transglycosylase